ncbi:hypothetical protein SCHIN_v1c10080 [Spiroplasma chinense]|uniref:Uncharacterized protein n=1 Tax=Spiroplasma chinense TaxID=216932 RepID=A0A5B9Y583_9MOLU|nr:hypothetical protein [Spiroplasma chinense]QEH62201.1 hypothetical protein SCHIN_v1c10080 [Spiroplasma chinense]
MKFKERNIENTEWITNFFVNNEFVYFVDSLPGEKSNLSKISIKNLEENLKIKGDLNRTFLANPCLTDNNSLLEITQTDLEYIGQYDEYVQNYLVLKNNEIISFVIDNKVVTKNVTKNLETSARVLDVWENNLLCNFENQLVVMNLDFEVLKKLDINAQMAVVFESNIFVLDENNDVWEINDFSQKTRLDLEKGFKKIFWVNKCNLLISNFENEVSKIINTHTKNQEIFYKQTINRAVMVNKDLMMCLCLDSKKTPTYSKNLLKFIF